MADGRRVVVGVRLSEATAGLLDEVRGDVSRSAWVEAALRGALEQAGGVPAGGKRAVPVVSQRKARAASAVPEPVFREPSASREPDRKPCKHEHVVKGWCNECKTGGHF